MMTTMFPLNQRTLRGSHGQQKRKENTLVLPVSMSGHLNPHTLTSESISTTGLWLVPSLQGPAADTTCHEVENTGLIPVRNGSRGSRRMRHKGDLT